MDDRTIVNELHYGSSQSSLACKSCRKKKLKCDRTVPQCRNCHKVSRTCEYPDVAQKPGPRPGTHRRANGAHRAQVNKSHQNGIDGSPSDVASNPSDTLGDTGATEHQLHERSPLNGPGTHYSATTKHAKESTSANGTPFSIACRMMQISEQSGLKMTEVYFDNMTAFSLFHQPTFMSKLASIESAKQMQALLTSMLTFSVHFMKDSDLGTVKNSTSSALLERAYILSHECLADCSDDVPPLHLLQSFILQAWLFSTLGVRGKSWRLTGQCIRMAYELRLHEVDLDPREKESCPEAAARPNSDHWITLEEKRRAWWAIWECDVFCSTIQRLPNGIDWTRSRTNLPCPDESWYDGIFTPSCHFKVDPSKRWRELRDSGNTSPWAWFVVLNSYKWESLSVTQRIAPPTTFLDEEAHLKDKFDPADYKSSLLRKRETLENCLRCAIGALPSVLQPNGFLSFEPSSPRSRYPGLNRIRDNGIYMILIMSQITQLLLFRKDLMGGNFIAYPADLETYELPRQSTVEHARWQRCLLVADKMAALVRNSAPDHHRHVNPNIATALWMAAATQLAVMAYHRDEIDVDLARSNLDLLTTTIQSFIDFWDVPKTLVQSLTTLEQRLKMLSGKHQQQQQQQQQQAEALRGANEATVAINPDLQQSDNGNVTDTNQVQTMPEMSDMNNESTFDLSPFDVLQAMDFGAMYNGVENWENLFLDPGFPSIDFNY